MKRKVIMRRTFIAIAVLALVTSAATAQKAAPTYKTTQLSDQFYCEGAYFGDFNKDGKPDIVSGPYWYEGPDFKTKHELYTPKPYNPEGYSENFLTFVYDFNGDSYPDVLEIGFPAKETCWYENPAGKGDTWKKHLAFASVGGESPMFADINGDGKPELLCVFQETLGYASPNWASPDQPWKWTAVTPKGGYGMFTHGHGFGDINGDGRADYLEANAWWEQPAKLEDGKPWIKHPFKFADAAAQMLAMDVDGDGKMDIVTAWHCHLYGIVWWRQVQDANGQISFEKNVIIGDKGEPTPDGAKFSQAHAFDLMQFKDGLNGFVVGKRWWAHGPKGDLEPMATPVVYYFQIVRDAGKAKFVAHLVNDVSGVGTQVAAGDLNGDGIPDIVVGNKRGTFVSLSQSATPAPTPANQPAK